MRVSKRGREAFEYYSQCQDMALLEPVLAGNHTALEAFYSHETFGTYLPTNEPTLLARAINGKKQHGVTVAMVAEDFVGRIAFSKEIKERYPTWVADEIFAQAKKVALTQLGFVPTFVREQKDFSELSYEQLS